MKNIFKVFGIIAFIAIIVFSMSCGGGGDDNGNSNGNGTGEGTTVSVTGVSLNKTSLSLAVGGSETLTATVAPSDATNKNVTWTTSDATKAAVSNGVVTAIAAGTATITITTADGNKTATCSVIVTGGGDDGGTTVSVTGVSLNKTSLSLAVGGSGTLTATVAPNNATNKNVTWASSNTDVATVSNGTVTAVAVGSANVTVTTADGSKTATCSVTVETQPTSSIDMVSIPAGTFMMGSPTTEPNRYDDETQHSVTLSAFKMGKYQVTQEQYQAVMGTNPSWFDGSTGTEPAAGETQEKRPVESVTWYDAVEFCNKLSAQESLQSVYTITGRTPSSGYPINSATVTADFTKNGYRLPTEAEWEYACRAGTTTAYNTGDTISDNTGWYSSNSGSKTHQVGLKPANAWGLYDMHGNVWEWCWDWFGDYSNGAQTDPMGASSGANRVKRGGGWYYSAEYLRSAIRSGSYQMTWGSYYGFRLVRP